VRLIRSKGVGVYFITQNPIDIPDRVAGQLGNRVQHKLNAFTPRDQQAVNSAAQTFRPNPAIDVAQAITELKIGEALVSLLQPDGSPSPVQRVLIKPPNSRVGPLSPEERSTIVGTDGVGTKYDQAIDRESAQEVLATRAEQATQAQAAADQKAAAEAEAARQSKEDAKAQAAAEKAAEREAAQERREAAKPSMADKVLTSAVRAASSSIGRQIGNQLLRGLLGGIMRGR
jgi:DNA helicase HerA-like ATPase